ncbi:MAG: hypothetical protein ACUVV3_02005 [Dehalococcoidia bacterium]
MKLFRIKRKAKSGEQEPELVAHTDAEPQASPQDDTEVDLNIEASADTPASENDPLFAIAVEPESESEPADTPSQEDDSLDPDLLDIFREAKNEVQESTLASELENISIQDLLSDAVGISRRLGIKPQVPSDRSR